VGTSDFNFYEWGRAMGLKLPDLAGVEIAGSIQPTVSIGDFADLTPTHAPPTATFGGNQVAVGGEFGSLQVVSLGRGGTNIRQLHASPLLGVYVWTIGVTRRAGYTALVPQTWSLTPPTTIVEIGTNAAGLDFLTQPSFVATEFPVGFWLPPGQTLRVEFNVVNLASRFVVTVSDVPASEGGE